MYPTTGIILKNTSLPALGASATKCKGLSANNLVSRFSRSTQRQPIACPTSKWKHRPLFEAPKKTSENHPNSCIFPRFRSFVPQAKVFSASKIRPLRGCTSHRRLPATTSLPGRKTVEGPPTLFDGQTPDISNGVYMAYTRPNYTISPIQVFVEIEDFPSSATFWPDI